MVNYLSYFNIVGGLTAAVVLICLGINPRLADSVSFTWLRGAMTLSMCCTALFFVWVSEGPTEIANTPLHRSSC